MHTHFQATTMSPLIMLLLNLQQNILITNTYALRANITVLTMNLGEDWKRTALEQLGLPITDDHEAVFEQRQEIRKNTSVAYINISIAASKSQIDEKIDQEKIRKRNRTEMGQEVCNEEHILHFVCDGQLVHVACQK